MEVKFAANTTNLADLIAALRPPLVGLGGEAPQLFAGVLGAPAFQYAPTYK